jgi:hypothetical protein
VVNFLYKGNLSNLGPSLIACGAAWTASTTTSLIQSSYSDQSQLFLAVSASLASYIWYPTFFLACYLKSDRSQLISKEGVPQQPTHRKLAFSYGLQLVVLEGLFVSGMIFGQLFAMRTLALHPAIASLTTNATLSLLFAFGINTPVRNLMHLWSGFNSANKDN